MGRTRALFSGETLEKELFFNVLYFVERTPFLVVKSFTDYIVKTFTDYKAEYLHVIVFMVYSKLVFSISS